MKLSDSILLKKNRSNILENVKQAKQYVTAGKLSAEDLKLMIQIDPTPTRKFVGWMAKQWINRTVTDVDTLRNTIEEYNTFLEKGKTKIKDINLFKSFLDLQKEVNTLNQSGDAVSVKDLERDYEVVVDNENLLIMIPHTHEASRKLGLSHFAFRDCGDGGKDSAWCTAYKSPDHFNYYYYKRNVTFYYIKVRSQELIGRLKQEFPERWKTLVVTAIAVLDDGKIDGYDGLDRRIKKEEISKFTKIIGIS